MKKFLAIYIGTAAAFEKFQRKTPGERESQTKAGMEAWFKWGATHQQSVVDTGTPLGKTKRISAEGVSDFRNNLTGYAIVQAETHEAAARMFVNHPHFAIFPGDSVEVMECLPLPGK